MGCLWETAWRAPGLPGISAPCECLLNMLDPLQEEQCTHPPGLQMTEGVAGAEVPYGAEKPVQRERLDVESGAWRSRRTSLQLGSSPVSGPPVPKACERPSLRCHGC